MAGEQLNPGELESLLSQVGAAPQPPSVFKARIGWFYTDSPDFPQSKVGPLILHWAPCAKAGGVQIGFPTGAHLYEGDTGDFLGYTPPNPTEAVLSDHTIVWANHTAPFVAL